MSFLNSEITICSLSAADRRAVMITKTVCSVLRVHGRWTFTIFFQLRRNIKAVNFSVQYPKALALQIGISYFETELKMFWVLYLLVPPYTYISIFQVPKTCCKLKNTDPQEPVPEDSCKAEAEGTITGTNLYKRVNSIHMLLYLTVLWNRKRQQNSIKKYMQNICRCHFLCYMRTATVFVNFTSNTVTKIFGFRSSTQTCTRN